ncbi:MAG: hypothetical protein KA113_00770 [Syntrophaceae bacterium]|nr:hypothetical protein [Syntrophaceae bacterium]
MDASSNPFGWPADGDWVSISVSGENETAGDVTAGNQYDLVGNTVGANNCPGLYYYNNGTYVFLRVRLNWSAAVAAGTFAGSHFLFLRKDAPGGVGDRYPQFACTWDSWSGTNATHGLEMQKNNGTASTWDRARMDDVDGNNAKKNIADIDGEASGTATFSRREGYIRTVDQVPACGPFGQTTFLDIAVKCAYFERPDVITAGVPNLCTSPLYVQAGTLQGENDHSAIGTSTKADVARGVPALTVDGQMITGTDWGSATLITLRSFTGLRSGADVVLQWETGAEIANAGFHVWRSLAKAGPYARITQTLIAAEGSPSQGANYTYTDRNRPERTWYYKLEDIDNRGKSTFHGPITVAMTAPLETNITLVSPANGTPLASTPLSFSWSGEGFSGYRLQFCASENFTGRVITVPLANWVKAEAYTPSRFVWNNVKALGKNGAPIYWRVVGKQGKTVMASGAFVLR